MKSFKYTTLECGEWFEALWQKVCQHCHWGCLTHPFFSFNTQIHSNSNNFVKTCTYSMLNLANHTEKLISWINSWKIYPTQIFTCASLVTFATNSVSAVKKYNFFLPRYVYGQMPATMSIILSISFVFAAKWTLLRICEGLQ